MPDLLLSRRDDSRAGCRFCSHLSHQRPVPRVGMTSTRMYFATLLLSAVTFVFQQQVLAVEVASRIMPDSDILQESIVNLINSNPGAGWEADMNPRFFNYSVSQFKHLLGVKPHPLLDLGSFPVKSHPKSLELPSQFDARETWAQCSNIGKIYDQGHCGSCWAFGAVESLSDRFCIHFGINISLSVNDLLACCGFLCGSGCDGGSPFSAWQYLVTSGVVTESCDPYFDEIGCSHPGCEPLYPTPKCERRCMDKNELWWESKHYSADAYKLGSAPRDIMAEVYTNGPVEVSFTVYEDFAHYKSGVYRHVAGNVIGGHAVKLIGWGSTEDGEDYWILVNQWNREWGEDGYFKMRRGTNECGVEEAAVAGLPSTKNLIRRSRAAALESTA